MNTELDFIQGMFDRIAPRYDFLNRLLSLGQDIRWRKEMVAAGDVENGSSFLDAACGTCDVALEIRKRKKTACRITGMDFSLKMLFSGKKKISPATPENTVNLVAGDALMPPFKPETFDAVFIAFGIRNIMNREKAMKNFRSCLKKNGRLVVLELSTPGAPILKGLYFTYFKRLLPLIGRFFSKDRGAYSYLPDSVLRFPPSEKFAAVMRSAGFISIKWKKMTFGIVTLFVGHKNG
ncbi:MAG: bifunctional demethylmenaquinone methyltransferase/2-methoxy-6-polyprenyl-1,4-benzoquinol methylase UbiE [Thermodesulfobacteriota bacterium]